MVVLWYDESFLNASGLQYFTTGIRLFADKGLDYLSAWTMVEDATSKLREI